MLVLEMDFNHTIFKPRFRLYWKGMEERDYEKMKIARVLWSHTGHGGSCTGSPWPLKT